MNQITEKSDNVQKRAKLNFLAEIYHRVGPILHGEERLVAGIIVFGTVVSVLSLAVPIAVQSLVNSVAFGTLTQQLIVLSAIVLLVLTFSGILNALQLLATEQLQRRLFTRLTLDLSNRIPRFSARGMRGISGAELLNPFLEISTLQKSLAHILVGGLGLLLQILFGLLLLALYHPYLLVFALVLTTTIVFIIVVLGRNCVTTADAECTAKYATLTWLEDVADMSSMFRSLEGGRYGQARTDEAISRWLDARSRHFRILLYQYVGSYITHALASASLLGLGGYLVIQGQLTLGQLVAAELVVNAALSGLIKFGKHLENLYDLSAALGKLNYFREIGLEEKEGDIPNWSQDKAAALRIRELTVGKTNLGLPLLNRLQLTIQPGEKVAIIGDNGSGKTILSESIYSLIKPDAGEIMIDGHNTMDIDTSYLRSRVALVTKPQFFHGTLEENIRLGCSNVSRKELRTLLAKLGLEDKIRLLDDGLETYITPSCRLFSYGEMLRIAVARALLSHPGLLILDQTLDGVDERSLAGVLNVLLDTNLRCSVIALTHDHAIASTFHTQYHLLDGTLHKMDNSDSSHQTRGD